MNLPVPSKSARLNMTEGERKWYSSLWPFDLKSKHLCMGLTAEEKEWLLRLWDVDLNKSFKSAPPDMTEKEESWYSLHWAFDSAMF